jgi:hypothetical protein
MPEQPTRSDHADSPKPDAPAAEPPLQIDASRWLSGPDADPLHELPWFARSGVSRQAGRPAQVTRPLKRPRRFRPVTTWLRLRNSIALVGVLLCIWLAVQGARDISAAISGILPTLASPTPAATTTTTVTPQPSHTPRR